jgi:hypothetical protein
MTGKIIALFFTVSSIYLLPSRERKKEREESLSVGFILFLF